LRIKRELQRPPEDIAGSRFNRAVVLTQLRRFGEAKHELDACLDIFESDPANRAKVLGALSDLYDEMGDIPQAIIQERRALALRDTLPNPEGRAASHNNIARYLERSGDAALILEAGRHQLASLSYHIDAGLGEHLKTNFRNYVIDFRRAQAAGTLPAIPRLADLLADPAFDALARWLRERQVDLGELQATINQFLAAAREVAERPREESSSP
jgi:tetratricopeptide (TPR) repeat protein